MESKIPLAIVSDIIDDPPKLINGSVTPVSGITLRFTPIFTKAWVKIQVVIPKARYFPKRSETERAIV